MKSKMFLTHLKKALASGRCNFDGKQGVEVLSMDGNALKCKHDGREFSFCVDRIEAKKSSAGAYYALTSAKPAKEPAKESAKKPSKKKKEDKPNKKNKE